MQAQANIDVALVGVRNPRELGELIAAASVQIDAEDLLDLGVEDERLVDPRRWVTT